MRGTETPPRPPPQAWGGLIDVLAAKKGETILVTAASGAVGGLVCQIAKRRFGCRVIGTAGGPAKCAHLVEHLKVDAAIDYKLYPDAASLTAAIKAAAGPKGLDMVYENVGGYTFDAAFACLGQGGRIAVCGGIASYCEATPILNTINPMQVSAGTGDATPHAPYRSVDSRGVRSETARALRSPCLCLAMRPAP